MWRLFLLAVILVYTGINIYTGVKIFALVKYLLPSFKAYIFWPLHIFLSFSFVTIFLLRLDKLQLIRQAAMYTFPFVVYIFLTFLAFDGVKLVLRLIHQTSGSGFAVTAGFNAAGTAIALGITVLLIIFGTIHAGIIRTAHYNITLNKNASDENSSVESSTAANTVRIALISDLHIGSVTMSSRHIAKIVNTVNRAKPDIICIAGDIFDGGIDSAVDLENKLAELKRLSAPLGVYACLGNHDVDRLSIHESGERNGTGRIQNLLENAGVILLQDESVLIADRFHLIGRRDVRPIGLAAQRKTAAELTAGVDNTLPVIFMDHQPVDFPATEEAGADLILSGHTHRGQFFPGNIFTYFIFKKDDAVNYGYWRGHTAQGIVTSGAGIWGPPVRIGTDSEVAVIDVKIKMKN